MASKSSASPPEDAKEERLDTGNFRVTHREEAKPINFYSGNKSEHHDDDYYDEEEEPRKSERKVFGRTGSHLLE